jgi:predicted TIM-barrel fold metal-dependent hydrolase
MDAAKLPKISADSHIDEPHDLWYERMDRHLRDRAPRRIRAEQDGGWTLVVDDNPVGWDNRSAEEAEIQEQGRIAAVSHDARLEMLRTDCVNAEIVYPTIGLYAWNVKDPEVGRQACTVYNDWTLERLGGHARIRLAAMIPTWDLAMAIDEVQRMGAVDSIGGLLVPLVGSPEWNSSEWDPLWAVLQDVGKPVVMHQGTGHDMIFYRGWGSATTNLLTTQSMAPRAAALLSCSGVLERHPDLHVVLVEVNAGWMAWTMSTLDEYYLAHRDIGWTKPILAELPSHYLRRQVHATFQDDPVAIHNIPLTGTECLLWGNDFPHPESTYPNSNKVLDVLLKDVADDDARAVVFENARRVFGFSDSVHEAVA